jgi:hypothetical protein
VVGAAILAGGDALEEKDILMLDRPIRMLRPAASGVLGDRMDFAVAGGEGIVDKQAADAVLAGNAGMVQGRVLEGAAEEVIRSTIGIVAQGRVGGESLTRLVFRIGLFEFPEDAGMAGARGLTLRSKPQVLAGLECIGAGMGPASPAAAVSLHGNLLFLDEGEIEEKAEALPNDRIRGELVQVEMGRPGIFLIGVRADLGPELRSRPAGRPCPKKHRLGLGMFSNGVPVREFPVMVRRVIL